MFLITAQLTVLEIAIFILASFAFVIALRFFLESRKGMQQYLDTKPTPSKKISFTLFDNLVFIKKRFRRPKKSGSFFSNIKIEPTTATFVPDTPKPSTGEINDLRTMLLQQQNQLNQALGKINNLEERPVLRKENNTLEKKVADLEHILEKKESELKKLKQQYEVSKKMQEHFTEMQKEFEMLQEKLEKVEQQAWESNELTIKLENLKQSQVHLEKDAIRKEEKIREFASENQRLHSALNETEDKLQEANLQRQQLTKKMQYLEEMNADMKQIADANRKLQNELRRIAELESMLNLITEERDELLKKKFQ